eukprot:751658-Hanusia_phi.AAC.3
MWKKASSSSLSSSPSSTCANFLTIELPQYSKQPAVHAVKKRIGGRESGGGREEKEKRYDKIEEDKDAFEDEDEDENNGEGWRRGRITVLNVTQSLSDAIQPDS